jgi:hypothetical protein
MIKAEARSDDGAFNIEFDAEPWFEGASHDEVDALIRCVHEGTFGGDYPADRIAYELAESDPELAAMLDHCERKEDCGFEVYVNQLDVVMWMLKLLRQITKEVPNGKRR